ncbi:MAG: gliding motility-associated protein GldE [Bacteroidia bacterium]
MDPDLGNSQAVIFILSSLPWWPDLIGQFIIFGLLLVGSFTASGAEVAYFSLTRADIERYREDDSPQSQRIWRLISMPKRLLATILITNNLMNVSAILVASSILQTLADSMQLGETVRFLLEVILITAMLLLFGEIVPKVYASRNYQRLVGFFSRPLELLRTLFHPLAWVLIQGTGFIDRRVKLHEKGTSLDDLRHAINLTAHHSEGEKEEQDILKGIVNFSNITVKSIMRARVDVKALEIDTPFAELREAIREHNFSRMPVYEGNLDHIKGVLHIKDLLPYLKDENAAPDLGKHIREVLFIPESKKIDALLDEFKRKRLHLAVVVDEFGGTAGIVTLEDVIEEIFGEITEEFDSEDWVYTKVSDEAYIFEGRISLIDVIKIVGLEDGVFDDARGDNDSLGGLILELHGKIPAIGEVVRYKNYELHVEAVSKHRITQVKMLILPEEGPEGD